MGLCPKASLFGTAGTQLEFKGLISGVPRPPVSQPSVAVVPSLASPRPGDTLDLRCEVAALPGEARYCAAIGQPAPILVARRPGQAAAPGAVDQAGQRGAGAGGRHQGGHTQVGQQTVTLKFLLRHYNNYPTCSICDPRLSRMSTYCGLA